MSGIESMTGTEIDEMAHIRQSIQDILLTLPGERVMRREYGSWLRFLIDAPQDPITMMDIHVASIGAIRRWEPRVRIRDLRAIEASDTGRLTLTLSAVHAVTGAPVSFSDLRFQP